MNTIPYGRAVLAWLEAVVVGRDPHVLLTALNGPFHRLVARLRRKPPLCPCLRHYELKTKCVYFQLSCFLFCSKYMACLSNSPSCINKRCNLGLNLDSNVEDSLVSVHFYLVLLRPHRVTGHAAFQNGALLHDSPSRCQAPCYQAVVFRADGQRVIFSVRWTCCRPRFHPPRPASAGTEHCIQMSNNTGAPWKECSPNSKCFIISKR